MWIQARFKSYWVGMRLQVLVIFRVSLNWLVIIRGLWKILKNNQAHDRVVREGQEVQVGACL
jgi:hypothetical protein